MAIEVELKARVADAERILSALRSRASGESCTYRDAYYDWPDRRLAGAGRQEVRVRTIEKDGTERCVFTFKGAMLDEASTPEYETDVSSQDGIEAILRGLGLEQVIAYTKECVNFRFDSHGREIIATVVRVPELGSTFLEIETLVPDGAPTDHATQAIHQVLTDLGLARSDLEPTFYVELVAVSRAGY